MKAVVVGGGIGGLASAIAIRKQGWQVEVLEQSPQFTEIGAGLSLWPNALSALDALGVVEQVGDQAQRDRAAGIRTSRGGWLSRTDTATLERRFGSVVMIHRAALLDTLRATLPPDVLRPGVRVHSVDKHGTVTHSAGESRADVVVGADGLRSAVRSSLWPQARGPRYAGYAAWRTVTRRPVPTIESSESWGNGERFGYAPLADGRVYCFAVANAPEGAEGEGIDEMRSRFADWHDPIPSLLAEVDDADLLYHDIYDLPPLSTFVHGQVALVGDAAHAMTPNLGQGACQAFEDAVVLAACLDDLPAYDDRRRPRTQMITQRSARIGTLAQMQSPLSVTLRNAALRATPSSTLVRSLAPVLTWSPP